MLTVLAGGTPDSQDTLQWELIAAIIIAASAGVTATIGGLLRRKSLRIGLGLVAFALMTLSTAVVLAVEPTC